MSVPLGDDSPQETRATIDHLPIEMISAVLARLADPCDVARCRMASRIFWTHGNLPQDRYPDSACPCSRHLRMPMPRSRLGSDKPYPGHGSACYPRAISDALARGLVDEADWLWRRYLAALCVPCPFDKNQRSAFPYTHAVYSTTQHAWYTATDRDNLAAVQWVYGVAASIGLALKPLDHYGAATCGRTDVVMWLLDAGLIQDTWAAAKCAARGGHVDLVRILLAAHRRPTTSRPFGGVWFGAAQEGHTDAAAVLLREFGLGYERPTSTEPCKTFDVETAASAGAIDALALLWQNHGGDKYARDAVSAAINARRVDVLQWLISVGARPDPAKIALACPCHGHGPRGPLFDRWRRPQEYGFVVTCAAIRCAFVHNDALALENMGAAEVRPHLRGRCGCDDDIDWRKLLADLFHEFDNPNAPTLRNKNAAAAMSRPDSDVSRMTLVMAQAWPLLCVAAGWLAVAVHASNNAIVEALLPHVDPEAAYYAAHAACEIGDRQLFVHLAKLGRHYGSLHIGLEDARDAQMAAFLMDSGIVGAPSIYTITTMAQRGRASTINVAITRAINCSVFSPVTDNADLYDGMQGRVLVGAVEAGSAETLAVLTASALAPFFKAREYHDAIDSAGRRGRLDLIVQLVDAMRASGHQPDPQIIARASVCARLVQSDDYTTTRLPLTPDEVAAMNCLIDGDGLHMSGNYTLRLNTCTRIARLIRRWPHLATSATIVQKLIMTGVHAAWLERLYATHPRLFQGDQVESLVDTAVSAGASDVARWLCRRCVIKPSFAARAALAAVGRCDVATAQCLLIDGGGATACEYGDLVATTASAKLVPPVSTSSANDRWDVYMAESHNQDEKTAADRINHIDRDFGLYYNVTRESKARAWASTWATTCWRPAPTMGIEPTGACHLPPPAH
nr:ankyrin repeat [Pandoravirus massiliensis]